MPDGKRKRRFSQNRARRRWYAEHRSRRFSRRFGWGAMNESPRLEGIVAAKIAA